MSIQEKLSVIIPSRNEKYLEKTIQDVKEKAVTDIEVLWEEDVNGIGHRALTNKLARKAKGEWLMKLDAHCSMSKGFDKEMLALADKNTLQAPILCKLDAEHWQIIPLPRCVCYCFNKDLIFDYWEEYEERDKNVLTETLSLQGSCFMCHRDKFFELDLCGEEFGSWGQQGVEIALKFWLTGGRVVTNRNAFYGHLFRKMDEFPNKRDMKQVEQTKDYCKDLFINNKWDKATLKFEDIINKFKPIRHW